ncbi:MAG: recombination protein RecR [Bdellovibrionales bacterium]|nr:recombination protein RecR [Bdellovibrionales bacterium]
MQNEADALTRLVHELSKLPGIGEKSATRLAYHLLNSDPERIRSLADALTQAKERVHLCSECFTYTENEKCDLCLDPSRLPHQICVVERPGDARAIEGSGRFKGRYHVLHGTISPVDGLGPDQIRAKELVARVGALNSSCSTPPDVIFALNPSVEGEATGLYLCRLLRPLGARVSKIAYGLPLGGSLEYADRGTIGRALENRQEIQ